MNILIILPNDSLGGAEQYLKMVAKFYRSDKEIYIYFLNRKNSSSWDDIQSKNLHLIYPRTSNGFLATFYFIFNILKQNKTYEYIFTSHVYTNGLAGILISLGILNKEFFVARESTSIFIRFKGFKLKSYKFFYRFGYGQIDLLICQTKKMKEQLLSGLPRLSKKLRIKVIENPIDIDSIKENNNELDIEQSLPEDYLVSAGRLIPLKGFDNLIRSFSEIVEIFPNLNLVILGDGPELNNLKRLAEKLAIGKVVHFPGFVDNVYPYFKNARACIVSSLIEGFPNVLLQMMSQNTKVISTLCAGGVEDIPEIYTCRPNDEAGLKESIIKALFAEPRKKSIEIIFSTFLRKRSIESFIKRINQCLAPQ